MNVDADPSTAAPGGVSVEIRRLEDVTTLVFNRPRRANALDATTVELLLDATTGATADGTRALGLRGAGRHFCGGFDMEAVLQQSEGDLLLRFVRIEQLLQLVRGAPFHTVACVAGKAVGAGADLVAACAHRLLTPHSTLRIPGVKDNRWNRCESRLD
jgi:enoyl-CoA hydratase